MLKRTLGELVFFLDRQRYRKQVLANAIRLNGIRNTAKNLVKDTSAKVFKLGRFKGFIFDMDGLVLDTEPTYFAAWQMAVSEMGYQLEAESFKKLSGSTYADVERELKMILGLDFSLDLFKQAGMKFWRKHILDQGILIKPGVLELLDYAEQNQIPVCLATNSWAVYAKHCLAIAGILPRFPLRVTGDDVKQVKPAPDIFLKAACLMQVDIRQCVVFEDSPPGIQAASASGAYSVYVPSILPADRQSIALCNLMLDDLTQAFESLPIASTFRI